MASKPLDTLALLEVLFILVLDVLLWLSTSTVTETLGGSVRVSDWWFDNISAAPTPVVGSLLLLMLFEKRWVYSERETVFEIFNVY